MNPAALFQKSVTWFYHWEATGPQSCFCSDGVGCQSLPSLSLLNPLGRSEGLSAYYRGARVTAGALKSFSHLGTWGSDLDAVFPRRALRDSRPVPTEGAEARPVGSALRRDRGTGGGAGDKTGQADLPRPLLWAGPLEKGSSLRPALLYLGFFLSW